MARKRDPRTFRSYARVDGTGTVLAVIEIADGSPAPTDVLGVVHVDVSDLKRVDPFTSPAVAARARAQRVLESTPPPPPPFPAPVTAPGVTGV